MSFVYLIYLCMGVNWIWIGMNKLQEKNYNQEEVQHNTGERRELLYMSISLIHPTLKKTMK